MTKQEILDTFKDIDFVYNNSSKHETLSQMLDELLKEQEPKIGHWIDSAGDDKCSVCGATYSDLYPDYQHTHYCPNCGAKMIGTDVSDTNVRGILIKELK